MPVSIEKTEIKNELKAGSVDFLLGNVGDKITIEHTIKIETSVVASTSNEVTMKATDGFISQAGSEWIFDPAARFSDFRVGDLVYIAEYNPFASKGVFTILEKLDDSTIRIDTSGGSPGYPADTTVDRVGFSIANPITSIEYMWNLIENDDQPVFDSKISGTKHQLSASGLDASVTTPVAMAFLGKKDYQIGSATIQGIEILDSSSSSSVYISRFKIIHNTFITPFFLAEQWDDLIAGIAPDYFFNAKCLKGIFDLEARYQATDPNKIQTVEVSEIRGNSGWFNENFNTGKMNYFLDSLIFKDIAATVIPSIQFNAGAVTEFEAIIKNTIDAPFFSGSSQKQTINFCRAPFDASEYTDIDSLLKDNFVFDRALQEEGAASINGDNFGTGYQVLKDIVVTRTSTTELKITGKIDLGVDAIAEINKSDDKRYILWVSVEKPSLPYATSDRVALLLDVNTFFINNSDPEMIRFLTRFIRHPHSDPISQGEPLVTAFPEDELVSFTRFLIDRNGRTADDISIRSLALKVKARNSSTLQEFDLDRFDLDMSGLPIINDHQYIDFSLDRVFHIPTSEIRRPIKIKRRPDLDTTYLKYFDVYFPYLMRWEYWIALATANQDFFDINEPNNGLNEFWHRYSTIGDWQLYYELELNTTKNGETLIYSDLKLIDSVDYNSNAAWDSETIRTYDPDSGTPLTDGGSDHYILGYKDTRVEALFNYVPGSPILGNCTVVFGIEAFEEGGIAGRRRFSSKWPMSSDTWFKALDITNRVKLSLVGNKVKAEALIDYTKLPVPPKTKFKIAARLYYIAGVATTGKTFQDGGEFNFQDAFEYKFQDQ